MTVSGFVGLLSSFSSHQICQKLAEIRVLILLEEAGGSPRAAPDSVPIIAEPPPYRR